jgi:hypothetical protein
MAGLLRGGLRPPADVSPAALRATRALLRRRLPLRRTRAQLLAHLQTTTRQYTLPARGKKLAEKAHRAGVAARLPAPAVQQSLAGARALLGDSAQLLSKVARHSVKAARQHDAQPLSLLQTVPGMGTILRLVLRDELHAIQRVPRGQACLASCRWVTCGKEAAGQRYGTSGAKSGQAPLKGACSAAAVLFFRATLAGQKSLARFAQQ